MFSEATGASGLEELLDRPRSRQGSGGGWPGNSAAVVRCGVRLAIGALVVGVAEDLSAGIWDWVGFVNL